MGLLLGKAMLKDDIAGQQILYIEIECVTKYYVEIHIIWVLFV